MTKKILLYQNVFGTIVQENHDKVKTHIVKVNNLFVK